MKATLAYVLHSANLFGTERMALATLEGLAEHYHPVLLCPPGPAQEMAQKMGFKVVSFRSTWSLLRSIVSLLRSSPKLVFMATGVSHSLAAIGAHFFFRNQLCHLHFVHGGTEERLSYARKRFLNPFNLYLVAVSPFVQERLIANGVHAERIRIAGNFLSPNRLDEIAQKTTYSAGNLKSGIIISRVDPLKRVELLIEALERFPDLRRFHFDVYGWGSQLGVLRERVADKTLPVSFKGYDGNLAQKIRDYDFMLHLCPEEPFGLAVLEAQWAGLPVLVPNRGGIADLVTANETGFFFEADQCSALREGLNQLSQIDAQTARQLAKNARAQLRDRYTLAHQIGRYHQLIQDFFQ